MEVADLLLRLNHDGVVRTEPGRYSHGYYGVNEVLDRMWPASNFYREDRREFGSEFHQRICLPADQDAEASDEMRGHLTCAREVMSKYQVVAQELAVSCRMRKFAGTIDGLWLSDKTVVVMDWKTGNPGKRDKIQLSAYASIVEQATKQHVEALLCYVRRDSVEQEIVGPKQRSTLVEVFESSLRILSWENQGASGVK